LSLRAITKRFPGVIALENVDLDILEGEVHALIGENGAGKSTLCNVMTGIYPQDEGDICWRGKSVNMRSPRDALEIGIRMVYQERNLIPFLTGAQNICLGEENTKLGVFINEKNSLKIANSIRESLGVRVDVTSLVSRMTTAERQMVEIIRVFRRNPKLLILDEPTSSLTEDDTKVLFRVIDNLRKEGTSICFISHKLNEVLDIADRVSILRNGQRVFCGKTSEIDRFKCIKYMVNRELKNLYPDVVSYADNGNENILQVRGVSDGKKVKGVDIYVRKSEVVGFYGLVGSGRTEFAEILYGCRRRETGTIIFDGKVRKAFGPMSSIQAGMYLVPEDRKENGLFENLSLKQNISISFLKKISTPFLKFVRFHIEHELISTIANSRILNIKYSDINQDIKTLSGGNKQKIVIGRWINQDEMKLIVMDEPTQGIDVGTKYEIYSLIRDLAKKGIGVIFISSELPELLGVCDRLYVFKDGRIAADMNRSDFDMERALNYAIA
jgi:ABC-type sugar transport system ATPase subunit